MNLRQMQVFHAIMTHGSVTDAARALDVAQPSVSAVLKHAEQTLGAKLFARIGGRLVPTPEAEMLFPEVRADLRPARPDRAVCARPAGRRIGAAGADRQPDAGQQPGAARHRPLPRRLPHRTHPPADGGLQRRDGGPRHPARIRSRPGLWPEPGPAQRNGDDRAVAHRNRAAAFAWAGAAEAASRRANWRTSR